jgi:hypothetical protein
MMPMVLVPQPSPSLQERLHHAREVGQQIQITRRLVGKMVLNLEAFRSQVSIWARSLVP